MLSIYRARKIDDLKNLDIVHTRLLVEGADLEILVHGDGDGAAWFRVSGLVFGLGAWGVGSGVWCLGFGVWD